MIRKSPTGDRFILRVIDKTPKRKKSKSRSGKRSKSKSPKNKRGTDYYLNNDLDMKTINDNLKETISNIKLGDSDLGSATNPIENSIITKSNNIEYPINKYQSKLEMSPNSKTITIKNSGNSNKKNMKITDRLSNSSKQMRWSPKNITYNYDPNKSILENNSVVKTIPARNTIDYRSLKPLVEPAKPILYNKQEASIQKTTRPLVSPKAQQKIDKFVRSSYIDKKPLTIPKKTPMELYKNNSVLAKSYVDSSITEPTLEMTKKISIKTNMENFRELVSNSSDHIINSYLLDNNIDKLVYYSKLPMVEDRYICVVLSNNLDIRKICLE